RPYDSPWSRGPERARTVVGHARPGAARRGPGARQVADALRASRRGIGDGSARIVVGSLCPPEGRLHVLRRSNVRVPGRPRRPVGRAFRVIALTAGVALLVLAPATAAEAKKAKKPKPTATSAVVLARLKVLGPVVSVKAVGTKKYVKAKDSQVLHQGDA